jgi:hypothetical protein
VPNSGGACDGGAPPAVGTFSSNGW